MVYCFCFSPTPSVDMSQSGDKSYFTQCLCPWHVLVWNQAGTGGVLKALLGCNCSRDVPEFQPQAGPPEFIANALSKWFFSPAVWLHYLPVSFSLQSNFCFVLAGLVQRPLTCVDRFPWSRAQYLPALLTKAVWGVWAACSGACKGFQSGKQSCVVHSQKAALRGCSAGAAVAAHRAADGTLPPRLQISHTSPAGSSLQTGNKQAHTWKQESQPYIKWLNQCTFIEILRVAWIGLFTGWIMEILRASAML